MGVRKPNKSDAKSELVNPHNEDSFPPKRGRGFALAGLWVMAIGLTAGCVGLLHVLGTFWTPNTAPIPGVKWSQCDTTVQCATIDVPLDYFNASAGTASLAVARYPAKDKKTRLGTLFLNPGGPGGSGSGFIYPYGSIVSEIVDGKYDIVSWDPRGINATKPTIDCFNSQTAQDLFSLNIRDADNRNLSDPDQLAAYANELRKIDALHGVAAHLCQDMSGDGLKYISTATVARDLERLSTVLDGPEAPANFWGFSYGTAVGMYFVNMFPDRVGRVIIDGNLDVEGYATESLPDTMRNWLVDTETTLYNFYSGCIEAGPERCKLASKAQTPEELANLVDKMLDDLVIYPLPVPHAKRPSVLTMAIVQARMYIALYGPRGWPVLASELAAAIDGDGAPILNVVQSTVELDSTIRAQTAYANPAIICADSNPYDEDVDKTKVLEHIIEQNVIGSRLSPHFGAVFGATECQHWKTQAVERFSGPFNHTLANTILVIGNTADPVTPLRNAKKNRNHLRDSSRLIIQDSSGHCSLTLASLCTAKAVKAYFLNGTLPEDELFCSVDEKLFPSTEHQYGVWSQSDFSSEELVLLENVKKLGEGMQENWTIGKPRWMFDS